MDSGHRPSQFTLTQSLRAVSILSPYWNWSLVWRTGATGGARFLVAGADADLWYGDLTDLWGDVGEPDCIAKGFDAMGRAAKLLLMGFSLGVVCQAAFAGMLLDLTRDDLFGTINGAWFVEVGAGSTGTGTYESFMQLSESNGDNDTYELGYNSDYGSTRDNPELRSTAKFNHTIRFSGIPLVRNPTNGIGQTVAYGWFAEFRSDINELTAADNRYLSVDKLEIWLSESANLGGSSATYYANWSSLPNTGKIWDMGTSPPEAYEGIALNYALNAGSGSGDMASYIPYYNFANWISATGVQDPYVYVYLQYGAHVGTQTVWNDGTKTYVSNSNWGPSDGFDEWGRGTGGWHGAIPEPSTYALFALGLLSLIWLRRRTAIPVVAIDE